jgi:hypothetical protein
MRRFLGPLMVAVVAASTPSYAQVQAGLPEYVGIFAAKTPRGFIDLQRQTPRNDDNLHVSSLLLIPHGHTSVFLAADGERSNTRFVEGEYLRFYLRVADQTTDPAELVQFFVLQSLQGKRRVEVAQISNFSGRTERTLDRSRIAFRTEKSGNEYYVIIPTNPLPPGEYFLSTTQEKDAFTFGVDAK